MFSFFTTLMAGLLLASVNVAAADLSESQQCVLDCSLKAATASKCDISDSACICASSPYSTELTQCATSACKFTTASVQSLLKDGCPSGAAPVVGAAAANSADLNGARTGLVAVSAIGLVSYALLV
ncbi:hypothetical protein C8R43DRAFT_1015351 [Mycena crocata]|nr:hypothetical protein C8R43DRAFT_1015351 [Mycena crocata]